MWHLTQDQLERLSTYVRALMPMADIAALLEMPEGELRMLISDRETDASKCYHRTLAEVKLAIHCRDVDLATAGSPTAAASVSCYLMQIEEY